MLREMMEPWRVDDEGKMTPAEFEKKKQVRSRAPKPGLPPGGCIPDYGLCLYVFWASGLNVITAYHFEVDERWRSTFIVTRRTISTVQAATIASSQMPLSSFDVQRLYQTRRERVSVTKSQRCGKRADPRRSLMDASSSSSFHRYN